MLTVSFHKFGNYFFPGSGDIKDIGGVPREVLLPECAHARTAPMTGHSSTSFNPIMAEVMKVFQPGAVVLQCGEAQPLTFSVGRAGPVCATPFRVRV